MYDKLISRTITEAIEVLKILKAYDVSFLHVDKERAGPYKQPLSEQQNDSQFPLISFAVAGSGKTQSIFNLLATNWGHYLVSGNVSNSLVHQDSILSPRRGGASADTHWLFELFKRIKPKYDHPLHSRCYSDAIVELLANRQTLMERWISLIDEKPNGAQIKQSIYWLLFQTTCTPEYDPFMKTIQLRMLLGPFSMPRAPMHEPTSPSLTIIDEAQNELNPFWYKQPSLIDFIKANFELQNRVLISGTSLRIKDCREMVYDAAYYIIQHQPEETTIDSLVKAFRNLNGRQNRSYFAEILVNQVLEKYDAESGEKQLIDFLQGTGFTDIYAEFYFTKALEKAKQAKDETTRGLLESNKNFIIHILGRSQKILHIVNFANTENLHANTENLQRIIC